MDFKKSLFCVLAFIGGTITVSAQKKGKEKEQRFDTTMKVGKAGYRVICRNKNPDKNTVTISPIGFDKDSRDFSFDVNGRVTKAEVDDLNRDGFPDLVFYYFNNDSLPKGNVVGISSEKNESVAPIEFPDIYNDPKLRVGYKGGDEYFLMEGYLIRRFPVYPTPGTPASTEPGTLIRQIQYSVVAGERGGHSFKPLRSYEFSKQ